MSGDFAVIGAGRFGRSVAERLASRNRSVLVVDRDPEQVQSLAHLVDAAVCLDATDEQAFAELRLDQYGCVIVAVGADSIEGSVLVTALLRQAGVARIVARAITTLHARVLLAVGAHEVVNPEKSMGEQLADDLCHPNVMSRLQFADGTTLAEVECPQAFGGKSLVDLDVRNRYGVTVVAIRRGGAELSRPDPMMALGAGDVLVVLGTLEAIERLGSLA